MTRDNQVLVRNITRPARALEQVSLSGLDEVSSVSGLTVQGPLWISFDVGVTYNNQLKDQSSK